MFYFSFSGVRTMDMFLVLFGLQVALIVVPGGYAITLLRTGTAVHVLLCTGIRYLFPSMERPFLVCCCNHGLDSMETLPKIRLYGNL